MIDGGEDEPIAFVGGMVLSRATLAQPGHRSGYEKHDAFAELHGPVVADAEHNFVQRWNLANTDPQAPPWPSAERAGPLSMPARVPRRRGDVPVQLARTIRRGLYRGPTEVAGAPPFISGDGESTILEHYRAAFAAAQRTIYIENQHPGEASLLQLLADALHRGVQVVMIVPGEPMPAIMAASREVQALAREGRAETHRYGATFGLLGELGTHERFTLAALGRAGPELGTHREIYTHAKLCIVDGAWMTIGSANLVDLSMLADHSELNASIWGEATCLPLLRQLVAEHTDTDTAELNDTELLERIAGSARASRQSLDRGGPLLGGCHAIQSAGYGSNGQTGPRQGS